MGVWDGIEFRHEPYASGQSTLHHGCQDCGEKSGLEPAVCPPEVGCITLN